MKDLIGRQGEGKAADWILVAYEWDDEERTNEHSADSAELQFQLNSPNGRESIREYTLRLRVTVEPAPLPAT